MRCWRTVLWWPLWQTALDRLEYGAYVVTVRRGDDRTGILVSLLTQVSFGPPLILVGIREGRNAEAMIAESARLAAPYDALLMPTVAMVAPAIAPLEADELLYGKTNLAILRNPSVVNFLDGCALSIPCHQPDQGPVGLMIVGQCGEDRHLLAVGLALEAALCP